MRQRIGALWDCRAAVARNGGYCELILPVTRETAEIVKSFRDSNCQAICDVRIPRAPQNEDELRSDEEAGILCLAIGSTERPRYDRVIILRRDDKEDVSGIVETVQRFLPDLMEKGRLFLTELRAPLDMDEFQRAIGAARPVRLEAM